MRLPTVTSFLFFTKVFKHIAKLAVCFLFFIKFTLVKTISYGFKHTN